jgi:hypothetical protein
MIADLVQIAFKMEVTKTSGSVTLTLVTQIRHFAMPIKLVKELMESKHAST